MPNKYVPFNPEAAEGQAVLRSLNRILPTRAQMRYL